MTAALRLGVNIDHIATIRNARGGTHPDPVRAAHAAISGGADGITAHLREDRRHIIDSDINRLMAEIDRPLNLEMAATEEMVRIALAVRPHACCIVPEKRAERTTEGGLDVVASHGAVHNAAERLKAAGIRVSLFVEPDPRVLDRSLALGADVVELHTGRYCDLEGAARDSELQRLRVAARHAAEIGLECHAGHGLSFDTVGPVAALPQVVELNIGHFLVGEAAFIGLEAAVRRMRHLMDAARMEGDS